MGSRTTWMLTTDEAAEKAIHLYSHRGGESKFADTRNALAKALPRVNMDDSAYACRIFISHIVGDAWREETGFGIMAGDVYDWVFEEQYLFVKIDFALDWVTVGAQHWTGTISEFIATDFETVADVLGESTLCPECYEESDNGTGETCSNCDLNVAVN